MLYAVYCALYSTWYTAKLHREEKEKRQKTEAAAEAQEKEGNMFGLLNAMESRQYSSGDRNISINKGTYEFHNNSQSHGVSVSGSSRTNHASTSKKVDMKSLF
jgi:hypothetical protein